VVRSLKPSPADVLVGKGNKWVWSRRSNEAEKVIETLMCADVKWEAPSTKHWWNFDSELVQSVDAVIYNGLNQTSCHRGRSLKIAGQYPPQGVNVDCVVSLWVDELSNVGSCLSP
jgi:hypothetical protein